MTVILPAAATSSPFIRPDALMMSDILLKLEALDVSPVQRRDFKSTVQSICRLIGRQPTEVPANINWVQIRLRRVHPAQAGISKKTLKNIRSGVLKALELCGASRARSDWLRAPSPEWAELLELAPKRQDVWKLTQLAQYCSALEVTPQSVSEVHIRGLLATLEEETFIDKPDAKVSAIVSTWNRLQASVQGWPDRTLTYPRRKEPWTFPLNQFPKSFQKDVAAWINRLSNPDFLDGDGPTKPLRPATIAHWKFQIQEMASAIVRSGVPIADMHDLSRIVDIANLKAGLRFMMDRFGNKPTEAIQSLSIKMRSIARHHLKVDEAHLTELSALCRRLQMNGPELRSKNQERLEQFDDDDNLARLLHLPQRLLELASKSSLSPQRQALLVQAALCIEILLHAPMRMGNLSRLSLERHIRRLRVKGVTCLVLSIPGSEVKNGRALSFELTGDAVALFDLYMERHRLVCPD